MNKTPLVSVILPVFNASKYLKASVRSILDQTFKDLELIVIDDGSTDGSLETIRGISDDRLIIFQQKNIGLAATLNRGLELARANLIARQDNDDVSHPERLAKQYEYMTAHKDVQLLGTRARIVDEAGNATGRIHDHPLSSHELKFGLLFDNPFVHSSVIFRKEAISGAGNYLVTDKVFEDHNLWSRIARIGKVANLPESLVDYREVHTGMSRSDPDYRRKVGRQAIENISFYCKQLSREDVGKIIGGYYGLGEINSGFDLHEIEKLFNCVVAEIARTESIPSGSFDNLVREQKIAFMRFYYQKVISDPDTSLFRKLITRISRRWMLFNQKQMVH
jgi:glycosyltransferase involved in cell wall biosynthesis